MSRNVFNDSPSFHIYDICRSLSARAEGAMAPNGANYGLADNRYRNVITLRKSAGDQSDVPGDCENTDIADPGSDNAPAGDPIKSPGAGNDR